jgi:arginine utilization protein RocB
MNGWYKQTEQFTVSLVNKLSVTGTLGEAEFGPYLQELILRAIPQLDRQSVTVERTIDDSLERSVVCALARGRGKKTVILSGHFDVVSVENYGTLAPLADDPARLTAAMIDTLRSSSKGEKEAHVLADLESGLFLPGRGALDMKSGLAAGLSVLQRFSSENAPEGNLLFIAVCDEENSSHGMRSVMRFLPEYLRSRDVEPIAAINLDAADDQGDGSEGQAVFLGSVGKCLPLVYVLGCDTHAGSPFEGINADYLAAAVVRRLEWSPDLVETSWGERSPAPECLKQGDLKSYYDITTPGAAWCYFNYLTHSRPPTEILRAVREMTARAIEEALAELRSRANALGASPAVLDVAPRVILVEELMGEVARLGLTARVRQVHQQYELSLASDLPQLTLKVIEAAASLVGLRGPAAVVAFGSLHYPSSQVDRGDPRHTRFLEIVEAEAKSVGTRSGRSIKLRPFFPGVSDMSFLSPRISADEVHRINVNSPASPARLVVPPEQLQFPVVNIGPWGRDFHQWSERVYAPYSFEDVPELVWRVATRALA